MVVQHNMQAANANRMLNITTGAQGKSTEKLSSGYKINRAADDAAGLSISEKMRRQIRGLDRASTNAQDGISSVQTAEGALNEVHDMLQRMNELANQASNGTNSTTDRQAIQDEISQLTTEIDRVSETTKFNEMYMLKGDPGTKTINLKAHDAGLDGTLSDQGATATFTAEFKTDSDIKIAGNSYHIYEDDDQVAKYQEKLDDAETIMINGTTYTRQPKSGGTAAIEADPAKAAELEGSAADLQGSAADLQGSVAEIRGSAALMSQSAAEFSKSASDISACAANIQSSADNIAKSASEMQKSAATKKASADTKYASVATKLDSASTKQGSADTKTSEADSLMQSGNSASAATIYGSAATLSGSASDLKGSASNIEASAAAMAKSASEFSKSASDISACASNIRSSAQSIAKSASQMLKSATTKQASADTKLKSAETKQASADTKTQCAAEKKACAAILKTGADAVEGTEATVFTANDKEYTIEELKAMIVDGAKVGVDGEKARTAVDTKNNTNNKTIDEVKDMMQKALRQANQVGVDDETKVEVSEAVQTGDRFEYTITKGTVEVAKDFSFNLHVGADADLSNKIGVDIEVMNSKNLGVQGLQVVDDSGTLATYAIDAIEDAIQKVNEQRSALGAVQNRLEHTITNLDNVVENTQSAESTIRDTDIADEMVRYSKNNILSQAGQSMLAQANQSTQGALSLLG